MSNVRRADPYHKLVRAVIVLLVLFVVLLTAYLLVDSYRRGQLEQQQKAIIEQNNAMVEEYNQAVLAQQAGQTTEEAPAWPQAKAEGIDILELKGFAVKGTEPATVSRAEALQGGLLVVNRWHALPADFSIVEPELKSIMDTTERRVPVVARVMSLFPNAITALDEMLAAAKDDGLQDFLIRDAYRSMQTQTEYWDKEAARYTARLTGDALTEQVRKAVSFPGTSDYQAGLSISIDAYSANDPVLNTKKFQETEQSKWLYENAWKYGYVFRFPVSGYPEPSTVDKSYKTGINLQMDTYRYVGVPHALVMQQKGFTLEEYVEYLVEQKHIAVYEDGVLAYEIFRIENAGIDTNFSLPSGAQGYVASADNLGGLIVAVSY